MRASIAASETAMTSAPVQEYQGSDRRKLTAPPIGDLVFGHRDEHVASVTPDEHEGGLPRLDVLKLLRDLAHVAHLVSVHFEDHVVREHAGVGRRAVAIDVGHD